MTYLIGVFVGLTIGGLMNRQSLFVQRRVYPLLLIVIAVFYVLFGFVANVPEVFVTELRIAFAFFMLALVGFNYMAHLLMFGFVGHAVYDLMHDHVVLNAAVPVWWPEFCAAVDIVLAVFVWFVIQRVKQAEFKKQ